jgi:aspartyl-tRNA(Asn)/glutamyl-tRNA(Gln) amidotransferase subunit B
MPDPDLPPITLTDEQISEVKDEMPVLPAEWRTRLQSLGLDKAAMELLLEAELDDPAVHYLPLIEEAIADKDFARQLANWFVNLEVPLKRENADDAQKAAWLTNQGRLKLYRDVAALVKANKLSSSNAKQLLTTVLTSATEIHDAEAYAKQHNLIQESDTGALEAIAKKVIEDNVKAAEDVRGGEMKAIGFLVGQVMKASQGRANPALAAELIKKQLGL